MTTTPVGADPTGAAPVRAAPVRAALVTTLEGPGAVTVADVPAPTPAPDEAVVDVRAVGLNHADLLLAGGRYQVKPPLPFSPGAEIAGVVAHAPIGSDLAVGQRVMAYVGHGGLRGRIAVAPWRLVPIPAGVDDAQAAGVAVTYGTAIQALRGPAGLAAGETVLVLGAAGGAGLAAVEIARLLGARVIAVASAEKHDVCRAAGADAVIDRDVPDLKRAVRDAHGGAGPEVVYDCVGGALAEPALRSLCSGGRFLVVGFASRTVPRLPLDIVLVKRLAIHGIHWPDTVLRDTDGYRADMATLLAAVAEGRLRPRIQGRWPLTEVNAALAVLDGGATRGKVIVDIA